MRILQLTAYYPPSIGGVQYFCQSLSEYLVRNGHQVTVLTIASERDVLKHSWRQGVRIRRCRPNLHLYRALFSFEFTKAVLTSSQYDVYHIHIPFHTGLEASLLAASKNGIPLVATHHGEAFRGSLLYGVLSRCYSLVFRSLMLAAVNRTIFLTPSYMQTMWLPRAVKKKVCVVPTGSEIERFSPCRVDEAIRVKYRLDPLDPLILFVGYLGQSNRYKGTEVLVKAMEEVNRQVPRAKLMIVGGGGLLNDLRIFTKSLQLTESVIFTGPIDNQYLPDYYAAADMLVLPSVSGPENSPVVVFEAMASAKPVVASNLPGVRDIVRHGKTGLLVPPGDVTALANAVTFMLVDDVFRRAAGNTARQTSEAFSWDHCALAMASIYKELIDENLAGR